MTTIVIWPAIAEKLLGTQSVNFEGIVFHYLFIYLFTSCVDSNVNSTSKQNVIITKANEIKEFGVQVKKTFFATRSFLADIILKEKCTISDSGLWHFATKTDFNFISFGLFTKEYHSLQGKQT